MTVLLEVLTYAIKSLGLMLLFYAGMNLLWLTWGYFFGFRQANNLFGGLVFGSGRPRRRSRIKGSRVDY